MGSTWTSGIPTFQRYNSSVEDVGKQSEMTTEDHPTPVAFAYPLSIYDCRVYASKMHR